MHGKPLIWLDNAAAAQKPQAVIDRLSWFYEHENSNIHRSTPMLAEEASDLCEAARSNVVAFLGASSLLEIVFVRGATEGPDLLGPCTRGVCRNLGVVRLAVFVVAFARHISNMMNRRCLHLLS